MQPAIAANIQDPRAEVRSSVFLNAVLTHSGESTAVRVRNLSVTGALLEGSALPPEGTGILLRRGDLCAAAAVAWQKSNNCGIRFDRPINVEPWVSRIGHAGQRRVDDIVATIRAGNLPRGRVESPTGDDLEDISHELSRMSEDFSNLPTMTIELAERVLQLDAVAQRLRNWVTNKE
jgi:hypothetical protein